MNAIIERMRNDGYTAVLYDMKPLNGGDYMAIYPKPHFHLKLF